MSTMTTIAWGVTGLIAFLIFLAIYNRQKLQAILAEGLQIYFDGEPRQILEVITYDYNRQMNKIALLLNDPANWGEIFKTGFIYTPEDFSPNVLDLDWRSYRGVIKCYKSLDATADGREYSLKESHAYIKKLRQENEIHKGIASQQIKEYGQEQLAEERKQETYHRAGALRDIKKLTGEVEVNKKESDKDLMKRLMNT